MSKIALYARVSTTDQQCENQLDELREYARRRRVGVVEFVDHGVSGAKDRRPALDKLMQAARRHEIDAIVVTKLDRLARSTRHLLNLSAELEALGVALVALDQDVNTSTPVGRFFVTVLAAVAEFERGLLLERQATGIARAKRSGTKTGRPFGRPSAVTPEKRARIERLARAGKSVREVAAMVGISVATVGRVTKSLKGDEARRARSKAVQRL